MLQHFGVIPFLIFDGDYLPSKAATETDRAKRREESRKAGLELLKAGKSSQAYLELQKAVDVTPEMARQLIDELKKAGVQYIVAPYEADAQMVYLETKGIIHGILSEDSDLLVFGAKCLLTKLDQYGNCIEINKADFCACREVSLTGWTETEFRRMAILSGCDYLASINKMGLKTAYRMIRKHKTIEKVLRMLSFDGKFRVPKGYLEAFYRAELTFLHQRVFCPKKLCLVLHTEPDTPIDEESMPFIGAYVEPEIAQGVARGDLNPMTKLPIVVDQTNKMASPNTPWAASKARSQRSNSSNDLKRGKPIDTFFKPKRVPLAELDINCFTPSPAQQEALRRNSGPWLATPTPRPYLNRGITETGQLPQSVPAPARNSGRDHIRVPSISEPRPPKRARLCEEANIDSPSSSLTAELGRSRFFKPAAAEPSPTSGRIPGRLSNRKKKDINIFSDDSIEEALLSLPDFDGFTNKGSKAGSKISIFKEDVKVGVGLDEDAPSIPSPTATDELSNSQGSTSSSTPLSTIRSPQPTPTPVEVVPLPIAANKLRERFSFTPTSTRTPKSNVNVNTQGYLPSPLSSALSRKSKIPLAVKSNVPAPKGLALSSKSGLTPLQRLGATATNRSKLPMTPPLTPTLVSKADPARRSLLSKGDVPFPEVRRETKKNNAVEPASIPLPTADETENLMLSTQNGSEDMIIPDSESEGEEDLAPDAGEAVPCIDFGRFAYAAAQR
jgi:exonuclease-1